MFNVDYDFRKSESLIDFLFQLLCIFLLQSFFSYNKCSMCCVSWGSSEKQMQRWNSMGMDSITGKAVRGSGEGARTG